MTTPTDRLSDERFWRAMTKQVEQEGFSWFAWGTTFTSGDEEQWAEDQRTVGAAARAHGLVAAPLISSEGAPVWGTWVLKKA